MTRVSPQEGQAKWVNRLSAATADITAGIAKVTDSPGARAAAKFTKYQNNTTAAFPKWRSRVGQVTTEQWKAAATAGVGRIAQGAQQKADKYGAFAQQFYPHLDAGVAKIKAMPDDTFEGRVQRSVAMMRWNAQFKRS